MRLHPSQALAPEEDLGGGVRGLDIRRPKEKKHQLEASSQHSKRKKRAP